MDRSLMWLVVLIAVARCASSERSDTDCEPSIEGRRVDVSELPAATIQERLHAVERVNGLRAEVVERLFRQAGCGEGLRRLTAADSYPQNIVCSLSGHSDQRIVVGAHYDKVEAGEGAVDNWTGAALLPSLYESLRPSEREHSYDFIAFTAEEHGLVGSRGYVAQLSPEERSRIAVMVNMDSLGLGATNIDPDVSDRKAYCFFMASAASLGVPARSATASGLGKSDYWPFRLARIPAVSIHSITLESFRLLHTERDRLDAVKPEAYYQSYRLLAFYLALLDQGLSGGS
jgi:hypothetical protein